jgi:hypothetical protein
LCGQISFAAIYETITGKENTLAAIWETVPTGPSEGTGSTEMQAYKDKFLPTWTLTETGSYWRDSGSYIIVGSTLDLNTGELVSADHNGDGYAYHWVVIAQATEDSVVIYNPYTNTYQSYTWQEFNATRGHVFVFTPPEPQYTPRNNTPQ